MDDNELVVFDQREREIQTVLVGPDHDNMRNLLAEVQIILGSVTVVKLNPAGKKEKIQAEK